MAHELVMLPLQRQQGYVHVVQSPAGLRTDSPPPEASPPSPYAVCPPDAVVPDAKSASRQHVPSRGKASDDKRVALASPSPQLPWTLPLKFLGQLRDSICSSGLDDATQRKLLVGLVGAADQLVERQLQTYHESAPVGLEAVQLSATDGRGKEYGQFNSEFRYIAFNGVTVNIGNNGSFGAGTNFANPSSPSLFSTTLNAYALSNTWGGVGQESVVARTKRIKLRLTFYPNTTVLTNNNPTTQPLNLISFQGHDVRIIILRDKWGSLAAGTSASPNSLYPKYCEVGAAAQTSPQDFSTLFFAPGAISGASGSDPSQNFGSGSGTFGVNSCNKLQRSVLTERWRYEFLYDKIHACTEATWGALLSSNNMWYRHMGPKVVEIDMKCDIPSLSIPTVVGGPSNPATVYMPYTNQLQLLLIGNMNVNTMADTNASWTGAMSTWLPSLVVDGDNVVEFQEAIPISVA